MANQRAPGQTMVGFWADKDFTAKIDDARGAVPRSQWLRDSIADKLIAEGFEISAHEKSAPDRKGKGGPTKYPALRPDNYAINEKPSSKILAAKADRVAAATSRVLARRKPVGE